MKKLKPKARYQFDVWPAAIDYIRKNQKLTDHVEVTPKDEIAGNLVLSVEVEADSLDNAHELVFKYLNEFYDHYCIIKNKILSIHSSDQIDIKNLTRNKDEYSRYFTFSSMPFSLSKKELSLIYSNVIQFRKKHFKFLRLALKYYRKARLMKELEDRLINYFIALESLYSKDNTEITFKFSRRMALLLGKNSLARKKLVEKGNSMYRLRSKIVHGNESSMDLKQILEIDEWVKNSILAFVSLMSYYTSKKTILEKLDDAMIDETIMKKLQKKGKKIIS